MARVDLPSTPRDCETLWRSIRDAYGRYSQPGSSVAIVCLSANQEMATDVGHEFAARSESIGIDTRFMLWADDTRWADLGTGDMGLQTDATKDRIGGATVLTGRPSAATRSQPPSSATESPSLVSCPGAPTAKVIHSFGRADKVDHEALKRLVSSISRFLTPEQAVSAAAGVEVEVLDSRRLGAAWTLDRLWERADRCGDPQGSPRGAGRTARRPSG